MNEAKVIFAEMLSKGPECWPFDSRPEWLLKAVNENRVRLSTRGARDYAVIDVDTLLGTQEATPGDTVVFFPESDALGVVRREGTR